MYACTYVRAQPVYNSDRAPLARATKVVLVGRSSLYTEVKINCTSTIGTRPSGLYREGSLDTSGL